MKRFLLALIGLVALAAIILGVASFAKATSEANAISHTHGQVASLRTELATLRNKLRTTESALTSARSEISVVSSEVTKTSRSTKFGYCVEYFTPQDGNVMSYNTTTGNNNYTEVYGLVEDIFTPELTNGVWQCPGGSTFVPLAQ